MNESYNHDRLRRRMKRLREAIVVQTDDVVTEARRIADWRQQYGNMPWAWIGAAAAVGFLAIPRKARPQIVITPEQMAQIAGENIRIAVDRPAGPSLASSLAEYLGKVAINAVVRTAAARLASLVQQPAACQEEMTDSH